MKKLIITLPSGNGRIIAFDGQIVAMNGQLLGSMDEWRL